MEIAIGILYDFVLSFHGFYAGRTHDVLSEHYYIPLNFPLQPNFLTLLLHIREPLNSLEFGRFLYVSIVPTELH